MSPDNFKLTLDILTLVVGAVAMVLARRAAIGGAFGMGMNLILAGIFVLTVNHLLDTVFLANALKMAGHTKDNLQGPIVHRMINLLGFLLMLAGFLNFSKASNA